MSVSASPHRKPCRGPAVEELARIDALTGLPNRRQFNERLSQLVLRNRRRGDPLALLYVDVDFFKAVNDRFGHPTGDEVLRMFAQRLSGCVRASDMVARVGGDEFAVLVDDARLPKQLRSSPRKSLRKCANRSPLQDRQ